MVLQSVVLLLGWRHHRVAGWISFEDTYLIRANDVGIFDTLRACITLLRTGELKSAWPSLSGNLTQLSLVTGAASYSREQISSANYRWSL